MLDQIKRLTGPDRVRLRPAVFFGDKGLEGAMCALDMLLAVMAAECHRGFASQLILTSYPDGTIQLQDNGRGLYLGSGKPEDDDIWKSKLCELFCSSAYPDQIDRTHEYSYYEEAENIPCLPYESEPYEEFALCAVQYVSEFMDVTVCRDGLQLALQFKKGKNVGGISVQPSDAHTGTLIRFRLDPEVFSCCNIPDDFITHQLQTLAILNPGCSVTYRKETKQGLQTETFCFPGGICDVLEEFRAKSLSSEVYTTEIKATGKDRYNRPEYGAKIQVAICFSKDNGCIRTFHNGRVLSRSGKHVQRLLEEVLQQLLWRFEQPIDMTLLVRHLCVAVNTTTTKYASAWCNGTRTSIQNAMICDMAQDCVKDAFAHYIKLHQTEIESILGLSTGK